MRRSVAQEGSIVSFFEDGDLVGKVDYKEKSEYYIEDAIDNWMTGVMTVETVERYSDWYYVKDGMPCIGVDMSFSSMRNK